MDPYTNKRLGGQTGIKRFRDLRHAMKGMGWLNLDGLAAMVGVTETTINYHLVEVA